LTSSTSAAADLLERLAALEHNQWKEWASNLPVAFLKIDSAKAEGKE
jgi:hypothetical protein